MIDLSSLFKSMRARRRNISKSLAKTYGGKWTYDNCYSWWCDDGVRHVSRVSAGVDEWDNPIGPAEYYLYGDGTSVRLYL